MILAGGGKACFVFMGGMLADADDRRCRPYFDDAIRSDIPCHKFLGCSWRNKSPPPITPRLTMKTSHIQYDPANDTHITTLFLDRDEEGDFLDVDSSLMHSAEHGYYLARKIIQVWDGRSWETATDEEAEASLREHRRSLKTFRPLTPAQVIRLIVENNVPDEEGARAMVIAALDAAGMH